MAQISPGIAITLKQAEETLLDDAPIYMLVTGTIGAGTIIPVTSTTDLASTIGTSGSTTYIPEFFSAGGHNLRLVVGADLTACLATLNEENVDSGYILAPEFAVSSLAWTADSLLIDTKARELNCIFLADPAEEDKATIGVDTTTGVRGYATGLTSATNTAIYFPYLTGTVECPASVLVAALVSTLPLGTSAAGHSYPLGTVTAASLDVVKANRDVLYPENINPISNFKNFGFLIYGVRLVDGSQVVSKAIVNRVVENTKNLLLPLLFSSDIAGVIYVRAKAVLDAYLYGLWTSGLLNGENVNDAFKVVVDDTNNTAEDLAAGILNVSLQITPTGAIEFINVDITVS